MQRKVKQERVVEVFYVEDRQLPVKRISRSKKEEKLQAIRSQWEYGDRVSNSWEWEPTTTGRFRSRWRWSPFDSRAELWKYWPE